MQHSFYQGIEGVLLSIVLVCSSVLVLLGHKQTHLGAYDEHLDVLESSLAHSVEPTPAEYIPSRVKLYAWGDIMLSRAIGYYNKLNNWQTMLGSWAYNPVNDWCQNDCLLVFNLESLFSKTPHDDPESSYYFAANTKNIDIIHRLRGRNSLYLSLANNHAVNVRYEGVMFTRAFLDQEGIFYGGVTGDTSLTGYNVTAIDQDNIRVCLSSYTYDGAVYGSVYYPYTLEALKLSAIERDVAIMTERDCDVKIANLHRGREYRIAPTLDQRELGHQIVDAGMDLILWNHSHVPGVIEEYHDKYIVYSMGNHIFDQDWWRANCEHGLYDVIYDYELDRCTVPTYIGLNLGFIITKDESDRIDIALEHVDLFGNKRWIHYRLDEKTKQSLLEEIRN